MTITPSSTQPASSETLSKLDGSLVRGLAWTGGIKWFSQLLSWISTLIVVRLLTPEDYGLVGMATVYLNLVAMINEFGLGSSIVMLGKLEHQQVSQINGLSVMLGFIGFVFSCAAAFPLEHFYRAPQLHWVVIIMSLAFIITSFKTVPYSLLQKDMRFKFLAVVEGLQTFLQSSIMIVLAFLGFGYWTLVVGWLVGATVSTVSVCARRFHPFDIPRRGSLKDALSLGWNVLLTRLSWYVYSNADFMVAGRVLGKAALGDYTVAWTLGTLPVDKVTALIGQVTPAFFAAVQDDNAALRRYLLSLTEALALITFPAACGLGLVAEDLVLVSMGERWRGVILPLRLLAIYASFRSIVPLVSQVLFVTGESRLARKNGIFAAILMPVAFYGGSHWGTAGIATAWVAAYPFITLFPYRRLFRRIDLPVRQYLKATWPALSGAMIMVAAVCAIKLSPASSWSLHFRFGLEVLVGAGAYGATLFLLHRDRLRFFYQLFRKMPNQE